MNLSENLKKIRKENNLSQEQLAEKLGVSRQSISKWESDLACPEVDKLMQIKELFNVNIDDLLNNDIMEVNNEKESKLAINKYMDSFLNFVMKTINMFCSMNFKMKLKFLLEEIITIFILIITFLIIGTIYSWIISEIIYYLPHNIYNVLYHISISIYSIIAIILGCILFIHIFKIRYLDYYEIIDSKEEIDDIVEIDEKTSNKIKLFNKTKKEKIIIRNPEGKDYKFIKGLLKVSVFMIKIFVSMIALSLSFSLVGLVISLVCSFVIAKTGMFFIGILISIISCMIINVIILILLINFIINRKSNKKIMLYSFLSSLILLGIGSGMIFVGATKFNYISNLEDMDVKKEYVTFEMNDELTLDYHYNAEYIEEDRDDIKVEVVHTDLYEVEITNEGKYSRLHYYNIDNPFNIIRKIIKDINDLKIVEYSKMSIRIYASNENISKLQKNHQEYVAMKEEYEKMINEYLYEIEELQKQIYELEDLNTCDE